MDLHETQIEAINHATEPGRRFAIITGGAGTGKTTIIKEIADKLSIFTRSQRDSSVKLCAFAGKAAARLKEATGCEASTIHRMLQYQGDRFALKDLSGCHVIVDEASMVSTDLMAEIVKRKPEKLILIGDEAQLPPVGKGQPFHDLIKCKPDSVYNLTVCFRNTEAVFKAATAIRNGQMPEQYDKSESETWQILKTGTPEDTQRAILQTIMDGEIDFDTDIILCPRNGDNDTQPCTVKGLNRAIVDIVNPRDDDDEKFRIGDRVINTKNYSDHDVWNGTTGSIHAMNEREIWVKLDIPVVDYEATTDLKEPIYKEVVKFDKDMKKTLQLAYALSVHRAQGSQYRNVIFCALERDSFNLLTRSLIYTAVTRTQSKCIVSGQIRAFQKGVFRVDKKRTIIQKLSEVE